MNRNKEKFQETFRNLQASRAYVEEVIEMTEVRKVKKFVAKKIILIAAAVVMLIGSTLCVNAATEGKILRAFLGENGQKIEKKIQLIEEKDGELIFRFLDENEHQGKE